MPPPPARPAITGTARQGQVLTADKGTIADENGNTRADFGNAGYAYTYQWIRVDGDTETEIGGATSHTHTYTLTPEDVGMTIKVALSFVDDADNDEGPLTSAAYPATGTVAMADGNHAATGQPAITGTAHVGQTLTRGSERDRGRGRHHQGGRGRSRLRLRVPVDPCGRRERSGHTGGRLQYL